MRRYTVLFMAVVACPPLVNAQGIPVMDAQNLIRTIEIANRVVRHLEELRAQHETIQRIGTALGSMQQYRIPTIATRAHEAARWQYGRPWLEGLNSGDPAGARYSQTTHTLQLPHGALDHLPPAARRVLEAAYASVEITDSVAMMGGHQAGIVRGYHAELQRAIQALEEDVLHPQPRYHEMTTILDKVAAAQLISRRQDMATNQLLSHTLEQLLARSKRLRDAEAEHLNMIMNRLRYPDSGRELVRHAAYSLRTWRQP